MKNGSATRPVLNEVLDHKLKYPQSSIGRPAEPSNDQ